MCTTTFSSRYIVYKKKTFNFKGNVIFWIVVLFTAVNSIAKSFIQEKEEIMLYYYYLCSPIAIIISKIIYNSILMFGLIILGLSMYSLVLGFPVQNISVFFICILLASLGFGTCFTMISSIASKSSNSSTMFAFSPYPRLKVRILLSNISWNSLIRAFPFFINEIILLYSITNSEKLNVL